MPLTSFEQVIVNVLRRGGVGVLPTDTLYGIVGSAFNKKTVERIYRLRKRNFKKPMIVLIADPRDIRKFGIVPDVKIKKILNRVWPGKVSVVLNQDIHNKNFIKKFRYLHRGTKAIAFRVPSRTLLRALLKKTGPLVAPSANHEGEKPATSINEAKSYFGDRVEFYVDMGRLISKPSTLIRIEGEGISLLRKGAVKI